LTGGGTSASESTPEQFFQIMMRVTIQPSMDIIVDKLANMFVARANHAMEAIGKQHLYVFGGTNSSGYLDSCEEYDIETNNWRMVARLNEKKKWMSACTFNSRYLYSFGGCVSDKNEVSKEIECFDTTDRSAKIWEVIKLAAGDSLLKGAFFIGTMNISNSYILLFGGVAKAEDDSCVVFEPVKRKLEKQKGLLKHDSFYRTKYGVSGKEYAIVGYRQGDLHIYDEETKKWNFIVKKIWNPKFEIEIKADSF
jgi:N-acetylneuraminic acid mutarotase